MLVAEFVHSSRNLYARRAISMLVAEFVRSSQNFYALRRISTLVAEFLRDTLNYYAASPIFHQRYRFVCLPPIVVVAQQIQNDDGLYLLVQDQFVKPKTLNQ
jgi:hypothetical protein